MSSSGDSFGAFVGRFQPLHCEHLEVLHRVLSLHDHVFVGITNPDPTLRATSIGAAHRDGADGNPFTYWQRARMITTALHADAVDPSTYTVVPFPIHHPDRWTAYVPADATQYVRELSPWERTKAEALGAVYPVEIWNGPDRPTSATAIRAALARDEPISDVHPATSAMVQRWFAQRRS